MLLIYRVLCFIPTPGVDHTMIKNALDNYSLLGFINSMTGSDLGNYSIMAMGITPYINASIILQLLCVAIPKLEELNNRGEEGHRKDRADYPLRHRRPGLPPGRGPDHRPQGRRRLPQCVDHRLLPCHWYGSGHVDWRATKTENSIKGDGNSLLIYFPALSQILPLRSWPPSTRCSLPTIITITWRARWCW